MPIKYDFYAFFMIEETTGRGVPMLLAEIEAATADPIGKRFFSPLARLYWAGRLHENPNLKIAEAIQEIQQKYPTIEETAKLVSTLLDEVTKSRLLQKGENPDPKQESPAQ